MRNKALALALIGLFLTAGSAPSRTVSQSLGEATDDRGNILPSVKVDTASPKPVASPITAFNLKGNIFKGPLSMGGTRDAKAYGFRAFPIGLTVGVVTYSRSGMPITTELLANNVQGYHPENRADLGSLPLTTWADLYVEYTLRMAKTSASVNLQVNNVTNAKTWPWYSNRVNRAFMHISDDEILSKTFDWRAKLNAAGDLCWNSVSFKRPTWQFGTWGARIGARFAF